MSAPRRAMLRLRPRVDGYFPLRFYRNAHHIRPTAFRRAGARRSVSRSPTRKRSQPLPLLTSLPGRSMLLAAGFATIDTISITSALTMSRRCFRCHRGCTARARHAMPCRTASGKIRLGFRIRRELSASRAMTNRLPSLDDSGDYHERFNIDAFDNGRCYRLRLMVE